MPDDDRAAQISARLAAATGWSAETTVLDDLAWLLAKHAELLRQVEAADARASGWERTAEAYVRQVKAAKRAGAAEAEPLGGSGCICNLPNGLANHSNERCPYWVLVL